MKYSLIITFLVSLATFHTLVGNYAVGELLNSTSQVKFLKDFASGFKENPATFATWVTDDPCDGTWAGIICNSAGIVTILDLNGNGLNGTIPSVVGKLKDLEELYLYNNRLTGEIPPELGQLSKTRIVWLFNNLLVGEIPEELGDLTSCKELNIYNNKLTGSVPASLEVIQTLKVVPGNYLCATVPGVPCKNMPSSAPPDALPTPTQQSPPSSPPPSLKALTSPPIKASNSPPLEKSPPSLETPPPSLKALTSPPIKASNSPPLEKSPPLTSNLKPPPEPVSILPPVPSPPLLDNNIPDSTPVPWQYSPPLHHVPQSSSAPPPHAAVPTSTPCPPCAEGLTAGIGSDCACVNATLVELRFTALDMWAFTDDVESDLLVKLATALNVEREQLRVTEKRAGSVILMIQILPLQGTALSDETLKNISSNLLTLEESLPPQYVVEVLDGPKLADSSSMDLAHIGLLAGVSGCVGALLLCLLICCWIRCRKERKKQGGNVVVAGKHASEHTWSKTPLKKQLVYTSVWNRSEEGGEAVKAESGAVTDSGVKRLEEGETKQTKKQQRQQQKGEEAEAVEEDHYDGLPKRVLSFAFSKLGGGSKVKEEAEKKKRFPVEGEATVIPSFQVPPVAVRRVDTFSYKAIQVATRDFGKHNFLAERPFGRIYKAHLSPTEKACVVVLSAGPQLQHSDFVAHTHLLSSLHSCPKLLPLIGYSGEGEHRILLFQYMSNASLADHLHGELRYGRHLTWKRRVRVAADIATALQFLHTHTHGTKSKGAEGQEEEALPLAHSSLQAANVMLDGDFHARLAEYAMAALPHCNSSNSTAVLEAIAYQAPEVRTGGTRLGSPQGDVYSLGVLLLEMFTGRKPVDSSRPKGQQSLLSWVIPHVESKRAIESMVDPYLRLNSTLDANTLQKFVQLARDCLQQRLDVRPSMSSVVQALKQMMLEDSSAENSVSASQDRGKTSEFSMGTSLHAPTSASTIIASTSGAGQRNSSTKNATSSSTTSSSHGSEGLDASCPKLHISPSFESQAQQKEECGTPVRSAVIGSPRAVATAVTSAGAGGGTKEEENSMREVVKQFPLGLEGWQELRKSLHRE